MIGNKLEPFKFWCQKVLPNVYDDSLSYYEYLCKLNEYLNEVIGQINTLTDNMEDYEADLTATWLETKSYIDNYFNNLDVQQEINNKLDQMAESGALSTLLAPIVGTQIGGVVAEQIGDTVAQQIDGSVASQINQSVSGQIAVPVANATAEWLAEHITPTSPTIDATLLVRGSGADAKVVGENIAIPYSSSSVYSKNQYTLYNGKLYKCLTDITSAENFNTSKWKLIDIAKYTNGNDRILYCKISDNLFDDSAILYNHTLNGNNVPLVNNDWNCSDYFDVTVGDTLVFYVTKFNDYTTGYRVFFDFYTSDGTFISHTEAQNATTFYDNYYKCKYITVPNTASLCRVQYQSKILDDMDIMITANYCATEYIPKYIINNYSVNKNSAKLNKFYESDLYNTNNSINLLDERSIVKNATIEQRNAFPNNWSFVANNSWFSVETPMYLDESKLYRLCVMNPTSVQIAPNINICAFDENDRFITKFSNAQVYRDTNNNIVFNRFKIADRWAGHTAHHYRLQIQGTAQDNILQLVLESEYTKYYHCYKELPYANEQYIKEYITEQVLNETNVGSNNDIIPKKLVNGLTTPIDDLTALSNGINFDHEIGINRVRLVSYFSHDASIVIYNNKIYCAMVGNRVDYGDSPSSINAYVNLSVIDTDNFSLSSTVTNYDVSKYGDSVGAKTIISGTGVPNIVEINGVIRILFCGKLSDNEWYMMYRDFNPTTELFGNITICKLSVNSNEYDFTTSNLFEYVVEDTDPDYFISMNAKIGKNGSDYYCGVCCETYIPNSIIMTSTDMVTFSVWLKPDFGDECHANFEGACVCHDGYLYYALRQSTYNVINEDIKMLIAKISLSDKNIDQSYYIKDCASRGTWYKDGNDIYLIHNLMLRERMEVALLNKNHLDQSNIVMISGGELRYPDFFKSGDYIFVCGTGASGTSVYVRRFTDFKPFSVKNIECKFASALHLNADW